VTIGRPNSLLLRRTNKHLPFRETKIENGQREKRIRGGRGGKGGGERNPTYRSLYSWKLEEGRGSYATKNKASNPSKLRTSLSSHTGK
jgi:hypothetical protein